MTQSNPNPVLAALGGVQAATVLLGCEPMLESLSGSQQGSYKVVFAQVKGGACSRLTVRETSPGLFKVNVTFPPRRVKLPNGKRAITRPLQEQIEAVPADRLADLIRVQTGCAKPVAAVLEPCEGTWDWRAMLGKPAA